jgi:hypothetical protein
VSAYPLRADMLSVDIDVRKVPKAPRIAVEQYAVQKLTH